MESYAVGGREGPNTPHSRMQGREKPELHRVSCHGPREDGLVYGVLLGLDHRGTVIRGKGQGGLRTFKRRQSMLGHD